MVATRAAKSKVATAEEDRSKVAMEAMKVAKSKAAMGEEDRSKVAMEAMKVVKSKAATGEEDKNKVVMEVVVAKMTSRVLFNMLSNTLGAVVKAQCSPKLLPI
jgi:hypothetical protein